MTALDILLALAPCYKASAPISTLIGLAEAETGTAYGANRAKAVALLTLHWLALQERGRGAAPGQITAESEGDLSRAFAATAATGSTASILMATHWGQELIRLRNGSYISGLKTRMDLLCG